MVEDFEKLKKQNKKLKSKKSNRINKVLLKEIKTTIKQKSILKKGQPTLTIQNKEIPSVLNDPNRFFTGELNKEKRSLYFS